ncbi:response regulator transcription factor [Gryllotalpicola reticulitermitis]|uniref:Response regulator transcription factor n=1 Tax=Gryllotalpicola reticulitermitis TaxID=1184153 RepID=A0ABV8Q7J9_9MICO
MTPTRGGLRWRDRSRRLFLVEQPVVPRFFIRNAPLESKLDALIAERPVVWVCAPLRTGKRAAVSAWLDRLPRPLHQVYWLRINSDLPRGTPLAPAVQEFVRLLDLGQSRTIVVLELGAYAVSLAQLAALDEVAIRVPQLRLVVLTDGRPHGPAFSPRRPDIHAADLRLGESAVRSAFEAHDRGDVLDELFRLDEKAAEHGPLLGAYFEATVERQTARPETALQQALAEHLLTIAHRTMPDSGPRLMALLAIAPIVPEAVARKVVDDPREYDQLEVLGQRDLLKIRQTAGGVSISAAAGLRPALRRLTRGAYAKNAAAVHTWAADAFAAQNKFPEAISQLMQGGQHDAAVRTFVERWDYSVQHEGGLRTRMLAMALPAEEVFASVEAVAAVWIVDVISPGVVPHARHQTRLLGVDEWAIAALSPRGRLMVRTARALIMLRFGRLDDAGSEIARATADADAVAEIAGGRSQGLLTAFRIASARVALWRGDLASASVQFAEMSEELAATSPASVFAFLALQGQMLALTLCGEFDVAERMLPRAEDLCFALHLEDSRLGAEMLYSTVWLRDNESAEVGLREVREVIQQSRGTEEIWGQLLGYIDVLLLMRKGDWARSAQALRSLLRTLPSTRQELPLLDSQLRLFAGLMSVAQGAPDEALALVAGERDGIAHMPCFSTLRAGALLAKGMAQEALEATEGCVGAHEHAAPYAVYTHAVRAVAFAALGLDETAEQTYLGALRLIVVRGIRADFRPMVSPLLRELHRRSEQRDPVLVAHARRLMVPIDDAGPDADTASGDAANAPTGAAAHRFSDLTTPEWETLRLMAEGNTIRDIAELLQLSPNTIKSRARSVYRKLGASSRDEAVAAAIRTGVIRL